MGRLIASLVLAVSHAGFFTLLAGCQFSPSEQSSSKPLAASVAKASAHQQLIVKFKSATLRCASADIAHLAAQIDVQLVFVRPMSGDACVIRQMSGNHGDFARGQTLLKQHPSIEWVELDAVLKTM